MNFNKETMKKLMLLILYTIVVFSLVFHLSSVMSFFKWVLGLLFPFLVGGTIAFILNVPMRFIEKHLSLKEGNRLKRPASLLLAIVMVGLVVFFVMFLVLPQLTDTILTLRNSIPASLMRFQKSAEQLFAENPGIMSFINSFEIDWKSAVETIVSFISNGAGTLLSSTVTAAMSIASGIVIFGIAFVFAIYILLQKENLARQFKKLFYAYLPEKGVEQMLRILRLAEQTFSRFLTGQCAEAVVLGTMFFVTLSVFRLPYALLIGVLIAFTALIPMFGAFIGLAVGIFLMLLSSPIQVLWFILIFFTLQQIEGNLIYPHVVGGSVGLPSIWVLAAVSLGGSMMGIVGMLIFIPLCSVIYSLVREDVNKRIKKKNRTGE